MWLLPKVNLVIKTLLALDLLKRMLEQEPTKRIRAEEALKHQYLEPVMAVDSPLDENFDDDLDDQSDLTSRIKKINEEYKIIQL